MTSAPYRRAAVPSAPTTSPISQDANPGKAVAWRLARGLRRTGSRRRPSESRRSSGLARGRHGRIRTRQDRPRCVPPTKTARTPSNSMNPFGTRADTPGATSRSINAPPAAKWGSSRASNSVVGPPGDWNAVALPGLDKLRQNSSREQRGVCRSRRGTLAEAGAQFVVRRVGEPSGSPSPRACRATDAAWRNTDANVAVGAREDRIKVTDVRAADPRQDRGFHRTGRAATDTIARASESAWAVTSRSTRQRGRPDRCRSPTRASTPRAPPTPPERPRSVRPAESGGSSGACPGIPEPDSTPPTRGAPTRYRASRDTDRFARSR